MLLHQTNQQHLNLPSSALYHHGQEQQQQLQLQQQYQHYQQEQQHQHQHQVQREHRQQQSQIQNAIELSLQQQHLSILPNTYTINSTYNNLFHYHFNCHDNNDDDSSSMKQFAGSYNNIESGCVQQFQKYIQDEQQQQKLVEFEQLKQIQASLYQLLLYHQQNLIEKGSVATKHVENDNHNNNNNNRNNRNNRNSQSGNMKNIIVYTVQEQREVYGIMTELTPPLYNGVNPHYPGLRVLYKDPPMFAVDNFLSDSECAYLINSTIDSYTPAPVVGNGAGEISPSRTSSTCYVAREDLPTIMNKVCTLTGKPVEHFELPQVGRYLPTQYYLQHYDAFDLSTIDGCRFALNGGQRIVTVLIYLNTLSPMAGGTTRFPALTATNTSATGTTISSTATSTSNIIEPLEIRPTKGMALIFFPATIDGLLDTNALHAAMPVTSPHEVKYVSQIWIRQSVYNGTPSKRLLRPL